MTYISRSFSTKSKICVYVYIFLVKNELKENRNLMHYIYHIIRENVTQVAKKINVNAVLMLIIFPGYGRLMTEKVIEKIRQDWHSSEKTKSTIKQF